ncbi:MAG TPA: hypothetical protein VGK48_24140, partial [Terriglobia bacterium]
GYSILPIQTSIPIPRLVFLSDVVVLRVRISRQITLTAMTQIIVARYTQQPAQMLLALLSICCRPADSEP